jgi:DNA repair protein RadC
MKQYTEETNCKLVEKISELTGISADIITRNGIKFTFNNPSAVTELKPTQRKRLDILKEFIPLWNEAEFLNEETKLDSSEKVGRYFQNRIGNFADKEHFEMALLNSQNKLIATKALFAGTVNESAVYPREVVKTALDHNATTVIIAHNHPGGSLTPSSADRDVTTKIVKALEVIGIKVLDHVIATSGGYFSFAEHDLM